MSGFLTSSINSPLIYPYDFIWSSWAPVYTKNKSDTCPFTDTLPATFGLFDPLDQDNPDALGVYRVWWFTRRQDQRRDRTRFVHQCPNRRTPSSEYLH